MERGTGINFATNATAKQSALKAQVSKPVAILYCPSRRDAQLYPYYPARAPVNLNLDDLKQGTLKTDYAINSGDTGTNQYSGPPTIQVVTDDTYKWPANGTFTGVSFQRQRSYRPDDNRRPQPHIFDRREIHQPARLRKRHRQRRQRRGNAGFDNDMYRIAGPGNNPAPDTPKVSRLLIFGSPMPKDSAWSFATDRFT